MQVQLVVLFIVLVGCFIERSQVLAESGVEFQLMVKEASWEEALSRCSRISGTFLPDLGKDEISARILHKVKEQEMVWLYGKEIKLSYTGQGYDVHKYVEMSFRWERSRLEHYLCSRGDLNGALPAGQYTWKHVYDFCHKKRGKLYNISSAKQVRSTMPYLTVDKTYWLDKYSNTVLPTMRSDSHEMSELCIGIIKESESTFTYRVANCSLKFKYFCDVSSNNSQLYAPTIQRRSRRMPMYNEEYVTDPLGQPNEIKSSIDRNEDGSSNSNSISAILGPTVGGVVLIVVGVVAFVIIKKRKSRERYKKKRDRYSSGRKRRNGASLRSNDIRHIETDGTLDSITNKSVVVGKDKGKYVHLRESEVKGSNNKAQREGSKGQDDNKAHNIDQPGYYMMDIPKTSYINKKVKHEIATYYERFDPDPVKLNQQIKDRNEGNVQFTLQSELKKPAHAKKTPLKPLKKTTVEQLNDLDLYEQPIKSDKPPELPVKKFKGPVYLEKTKNKNEKQPMKEPSDTVQPEDGITELYCHKNLADSDQHEGIHQVPENAFTNQRAPNLQNSQTNVDDLGVYESYDQNHDVPSAAVNDPARLNDLDQYENSDRLVKSADHAESFDNQDQYENFASPTMEKKPLQLKDLDDYENYPLCSTIIKK